jgi:hypothetical protein
MLCPRCSSNQSDDVKFCKSCGANLQAVRDVLENRPPGNKLEWGDTWVAEMFRSGQATELRKLEIERRMGITPEVKRYIEIKAGVITSSVGIGVSIFLFVFMQGLVNVVGVEAQQILPHLWIAGVIPFFVGLALIINGLVVSKKMAEVQEREMRKMNAREADALGGETAAQRALRPADTNEFIPTGYSVTEQTTRHLAGSEQNPKH